MTKMKLNKPVRIGEVLASIPNAQRFAIQFQHRYSAMTKQEFEAWLRK